MKQFITALGIIGLLCGSIACSNARKTTTAGVYGVATLNGDWELQNIEGSTIPLSQLYTGRRPFLHLDVSAARANGNTGCNSFSGPVKIKRGQLHFSEQMVMTRMACQGEGESTFLQALKKVDAYRTDSATLTLLAGELPVMQFNRKLDAGDK